MPTAKVTPADVERVVRRDFPQDVERVLQWLNEYGQGGAQPESDRVRMAILKLANGSLTRLRQELYSACCDWRDVLGLAEYPYYHKRFFQKLSPDEKAAYMDDQYQKYLSWMNG